jgi:DNA-binding NtrC family response regulator
MLVEANRNLKIAVIDDQTVLSEVYSMGIEKLGYHTPSIFNDGTSIVKALIRDRQSFDVIIMDYRIPEISGIEAAKIIHRYKKDAKIIIATANDFVKQEAIAAGLTFLLKPFTAEQLIECLESPIAG